MSVQGFQLYSSGIWHGRHLRIANSIAALLLTLAFEAHSAERPPAYHWSNNITIAPPEGGKQRAETELATDNSGRVWLLYLDTNYYQAQDGLWFAWPRRLTGLTSTDEGRSFTGSRVLSEMGGNAAIGPSPSGGVYVSWVQYSNEPVFEQKIAVQHIDNANTTSPLLQCPVWMRLERHDQSAVYVSDNGTVHVLGVDNDAPRLGQEHQVLYAQSNKDLDQCSNQQRLDSIGQLVQIVGTVSGLLIIGPEGYFTSADSGHSFSARIPCHCADFLVRAAASPDHRMAYVVGDARQNGLWLQATEDGGKTWRKSRVDTAASASAWRYPAIAVSKSGRVHVTWMDDRDGHGVVYHAYSDDGGRTFSENARVSDRPFYFPSDAPPPPPATQNGTWIGDYMSLTVVHDKVIAAWSDQRAGLPLSAVYSAVGAPP
jgi:hypothetical protein